MENLETEWLKNRDKLEGTMHRIHEALKNVEGLPDDLDSPETEEQVYCVNSYAVRLYDLFSQGTEVAEAMMIQEAVKKIYEAVQDEKGETMSDRDKMVEAGHTNDDF